MRVTLEDVAEKAGVSAATVSICLNHHPVSKKIPEATKQRIAQVVAELGYRPSSFARALCMGYSNLIGIDIQEISNSYYAHLAGDVIDEAAQYGLNVIVTQGNSRSKRNGWSGDMLDGMIYCSPSPRGTLGTKPCVLIDTERTGFNCVLHDIGSAMADAALLMKERGHSRVCGVFGFARSKADRFIQEFRKAGLTPELSALSTSSREERLETVVQILRERPSALVINGHLTTRDLLRKLAVSRGSYHPDVISVCGFWNGELAGPHLLGAAVTDVRSLAAAAVKILAENIRSRHAAAPRIELIPARFYRSSDFQSIPFTDPENEY